MLLSDCNALLWWWCVSTHASAVCFFGFSVLTRPKRKRARVQRVSRARRVAQLQSAGACALCRRRRQSRPVMYSLVLSLRWRVYCVYFAVQDFVCASCESARETTRTAFGVLFRGMRNRRCSAGVVARESDAFLHMHEWNGWIYECGIRCLRDECIECRRNGGDRRPRTNRLKYGSSFCVIAGGKFKSEITAMWQNEWIADGSVDYAQFQNLFEYVFRSAFLCYSMVCNILYWFIYSFVSKSLRILLCLVFLNYDSEEFRLSS